MVKGVGAFFTEALAEFHHVNCMIHVFVVRIWEVETVVSYARAKTFTEQLPQLPQR